MAQYTLSLTGEVIQARLNAIIIIQGQITDLIQAKDELYTGMGTHSAALLAHSEALEGLNRVNARQDGDINALRVAISMIGPGEGGGTGLSIQAMTQEAYDDLVDGGTVDANTLYLII